jgi:hypothetical protein
MVSQTPSIRQLSYWQSVVQRRENAQEGDDRDGFDSCGLPALVLVVDGLDGKREVPTSILT